MAVFAPMPRASTATAVIVKLGVCRKMRSECLRSFRNDSITGRLPVLSIEDGATVRPWANVYAWTSQRTWTEIQPSLSKQLEIPLASNTRRSEIILDHEHRHGGVRWHNHRPDHTGLREYHVITLDA